MTDRDFVRIEAPHFVIEGRSRAGQETWFRIRELGVSLDIGRCPETLVSVPHIFVTHAHLDHALGIPYYAAQRRLRRLPPGDVFIPAENRDDYLALMKLHEKLEATDYPLNLVGVAEGEEVRLRRDLAVRVHRSTHRVVTNAYEFLECRTKLRSDLRRLPPEVIAERRRSDPEALIDEFVPILFYTGDTDRRILETNEAIFLSEVLMIECSFTRPGDEERAFRYAHVHIEDVFEFAEKFENEMIVLTHFSLRDRPDDIRRRIASRCPEVLRERLRLALPPPFTTL